ncbi:anaerobic ribonucleoside-triphosphate reductase activating protein [Candidatus Bathyarchaeota archaeon]|nr:anaerobic ribonucleoside-triphosphate reductase activating protein [Candidatus Bathyarchaeota archaeon]
MDQCSSTLRFSGIQKTSLIDYPDNVSTILFTAGCNLRCPYCHNWRIILEYNGPYLSETRAIEILEKRKKYIDHVVITGGEPTIQKDLVSFIKKLKTRGYKVKLDSNGMLPEVIEQAIPFLDYMAVDVKTSRKLYSKLEADKPEAIQRTINLLKNGSINYEFRCTVVPGLINEEIVHQIGEMVNGATRFAFQQFIPEDTLNPAYSSIEPFSSETISRFGEIMSEYAEEVILRI